jgi:hypothetical protein
MLLRAQIIAARATHRRCPRGVGALVRGIVPNLSKGTTRPKRVALYLRISTNEQTPDNQRRELKAIAARAGWDVVAAYAEPGCQAKIGTTSDPYSMHRQ